MTEREEALEEAAKVVDEYTRAYGHRVPKQTDPVEKRRLQAMAREFSSCAAEVRYLALKSSPRAQETTDLAELSTEEIVAVFRDDPPRKFSPPLTEREELDRLRRALCRIDSYNDNPAHFDVYIDQITTEALAPHRSSPPPKGGE